MEQNLKEKELPIENIKQFILAGNSYFTLQSTETGNRFTYRVNPERFDGGNRGIKYYKVEVLNGSNNKDDYMYIGSIDVNGTRFKFKNKRNITTDKKNQLVDNPVSAVALYWYYNRLVSGLDISKVKFFHAGRCGMCGRLLTTPESIESGFGPHCITKL